MYMLGALLLAVGLQVSSGQLEREPPGHRTRQHSVSTTNDVAYELGELYNRDTSMVEGKTIYLPLANDHNGVLHKIEAYLMSTQPVYLQIWRPQQNDANTYRLIHQQRVSSQTANTSKTFSAAVNKNRCPVIHENDRLGIFSLSQKTPIPVRQTNSRSILSLQQMGDINNDVVKTFDSVTFSYTFSVKFFIHEVKGNMNSGQARYVPCPQDVVEGSSSVKASTITTSRTKTTTISTTPKTTTSVVKETSKVIRSGRSRTPKIGSTGHQLEGTTRKNTDAATPKSTAGKPAASRVPIATFPSGGATVLPNTAASNNQNVLIAAVSALAVVAVVAIIVAVVFAGCRSCNKRPSLHTAISHNDSGPLTSDLPTPTSPNPAYGINCDFLNTYDSLKSLCGDRTSSHGYQPPIPDRPNDRSSRPNTGIYNELPDGSWITMSTSDELKYSKRATPRFAPANHTYLDLVSDDIDSGVACSDNRGSKASCGVIESNS